MSAAARAVTPVTVPRIIFSTESDQTLMPSFDAMSRERPLAETRALIRYGMRQASIAAVLVALSEKGVVAILIQELPDDEKLVAGLCRRNSRPPNCVTIFPSDTRNGWERVVTFSRTMTREIIRVEPLSTYLERWKAPTSAVTRHGNTIYVSGFPPFDPKTGEVVDAPDRAADRARTTAVETLCRNRGLIIRTGAEVQRLLHVRRQVRRRQRDLRKVLLERFRQRGSWSTFPRGPGHSTSKSTAWHLSKTRRPDLCSQ